MELDNLRPEVAEALHEVTHCTECMHIADYSDAPDIIRAELLRLTDDCARLVDCINAQPPTRRSLIDRAERAEAELAALKARIEGGVDMGRPVECFVGSRCGRIINPFTPPKWIGKRVRLVVEE